MEFTLEVLFKYSMFIVTLRILYASKSPVYVGADCKSARIKSVAQVQSYMFGNPLEDAGIKNLPLLSGAVPAPAAEATTSPPAVALLVTICGAGLNVKVYVLRPDLLAPIALGTLIRLALAGALGFAGARGLAGAFIVLYIDLDII